MTYFVTSQKGGIHFSCSGTHKKLTFKTLLLHKMTPLNKVLIIKLASDKFDASSVVCLSSLPFRHISCQVIAVTPAYWVSLFLMQQIAVRLCFHALASSAA